MAERLGFDSETIGERSGTHVGGSATSD